MATMVVRSEGGAGMSLAPQGAVLAPSCPIRVKGGVEARVALLCPLICPHRGQCGAGWESTLCPPGGVPGPGQHAPWPPLPRSLVCARPPWHMPTGQLSLLSGGPSGATRPD
ncbi:hypothetical protein H1C71_021133 [Ictidomys tridecemlineatus]|nr:hypothetical protein H1C71_021133 [Ictidomys tridecemlineatus]